MGIWHLALANARAIGKFRARLKKQRHPEAKDPEDRAASKDLQTHTGWNKAKQKKSIEALTSTDFAISLPMTID